MIAEFGRESEFAPAFKFYMGGLLQPNSASAYAPLVFVWDLTATADDGGDLLTVKTSGCKSMGHCHSQVVNHMIRTASGTKAVIELSHALQSLVQSRAATGLGHWAKKMRSLESANREAGLDTQESAEKLVTRGFEGGTVRVVTAFRHGTA